MYSNKTLFYGMFLVPYQGATQRQKAAQKSYLMDSQELPCS